MEIIKKTSEITHFLSKIIKEISKLTTIRTTIHKNNVISVFFQVIITQNNQTDAKIPFYAVYN
ncbi:MAG: hypothetical protein IJ681_03545 [Bacteroidales bacterium]|nr:hypothetical protein [Bacteroidales bacterium]